jgi:hypothetical protein
MNFYNGYITSRGLCKKFNVAETTYREWRDKLNLPKIETKKDKIPENFKEEYMKYFHGEISQVEVLRKFEISERVYARWRNALNLPMIRSGRMMKIPREFEKEYIKFYNKELSMKDLQDKFKVSNTTCHMWRDLLNLPIVEKCRNRWEEPPEPINLSDEFPDEVEY